MNSPAVVIDAGSGTCRAAVEGAGGGCVSFPCAVGRWRDGGGGALVGDRFITQRAEMLDEHDGPMRVTRPVHRGHVIDWQEMECVWRWALEELPGRHPVMLVESPNTWREHRERKTQIAFEHLDVPAVYFATQPQLALAEQGKTDGVVLSSGYGITRSTAVREGLVVRDSIQCLDVAGSDLDQALATSLCTRLAPCPALERLSPIQLTDCMIRLKQTLCHVVDRPDEEYRRIGMTAQPIDRAFTLPDGTNIAVEAERWFGPEPLFTPSRAGQSAETPGIVPMVQVSIVALENNLRGDAIALGGGGDAGNDWNGWKTHDVVLEGGSTLFYGLEKRLARELTALGAAVNVIPPAARQHTVVQGGLMLAALSTTRAHFVTKSDYDEFGPGIGYTKCVNHIFP